jgi:hypothetical protein
MKLQKAIFTGVVLLSLGAIHTQTIEHPTPFLLQTGKKAKTKKVKFIIAVDWKKDKKSFKTITKKIKPKQKYVTIKVHKWNHQGLPKVKGIPYGKNMGAIPKNWYNFPKQGTLQYWEFWWEYKIPVKKIGKKKTIRVQPSRFNISYVLKGDWKGLNKFKPQY